MTRIFKSFFIYFFYVFPLLTVTSEVKGQVFAIDTIMYNGDPNKLINMVFMSDGFQAAELPDYKTKVQNLSNYLFTISPFSEYKNYFNVFAIRVPSSQSGANHPGTASDESSSGGQPVMSVSTYFNSTFDYFSIHRLLVPQNFSAINTVLVNNFPLYDQRGIVVNSTYYGGSGGSTATTSVNSASFEILVHELGHSFANLADEYWAGDSYAAEKPNMTANSNPATVKWKNWVGTNGISVYPYGASGTPANWYRPHQNCKMQFLGPAFCSVCQEAIIETIHQMISPIESYLPSNQNNINFCTQPVKFKLSLIRPNPNTLRVTWKLNGNAIVTNVDSVIITPGLLNNGINTLSVQVLDTTLLTRADLHPVNHTYTISWNIDNSAPPGPTITAGGPISFCNSGSVILTSNASSGNQWYKDGNAINGSTGTTLNVTESGSYTVKVIVNGCESTASNAIVVTTGPIPGTPVVTAGPNTTFCNGGSVVLTSNAPNGNQWYKDGVAISGSTGTTLNVTSGGSYAAKVILNGCESAVSNGIVVTVTPGPPAPTISAGAATTFCNGGSVVLTSNASSNNQWYKDGVAIGGSAATTLNVTSGGNYTAKVILNGCESIPSNAIVVTVNSVPTPTITQNGSQLISSAVLGNQWYLNGVAVAGASSQNFTPTASGNYTVQVTLNNCTSAFSTTLNFTVTGIPNIDVFANLIKVLPNPVRDKLVINRSGTLLNLHIRLYDINGKLLEQLTSSLSSIEIDMAKYSAGTYIIWIEDTRKNIKGKKVIVKM